MSTRRTQWAIRKREWLTAALGGRCVICSVPVCLTFDCIVPTGDRHHRMSQVQRMSYYMHQARMGNLQLLCSACNSKKGAKPQEPYLPPKRT